MLVSFQLASKYPANLIGLFDNLEQLASDPACFEVLVKVDTEDPETQALVASEARCRKFKLRQLVMPRGKGYEELWKALNDLYRLTDQSAYFVCNINDEVRIKEKGWDDRLRRYVGLFPDHIYRLRTSKLKFRNYYDFWECGFAPENYAFFTKRWLDICGDWNPCFGPDSSQQYIAYYLGYANYPAIKQFNRDVPVLDISWRGEGVGKNLTFDQQIQRTATNFRLWMRQISHPMQQELFRRARLLQAHIVQAECIDRCKINIVDDRKTRTILLRDAENQELLDLLPYRISRIRHFLRNGCRVLHFTYYAGGGRESLNLLPFSIVEFFVHYYPSSRKVLKALSVPFTLPRVLIRSPVLLVRGLAFLAMRVPLHKAGDRLTRVMSGIANSATGSLFGDLLVKTTRPLVTVMRGISDSAMRYRVGRFFFLPMRSLVRRMRQTLRWLMSTPIVLGRILLETVPRLTEEMRQTLRSLMAEPIARRRIGSHQNRTLLTVFAVWILRILFRPLSARVARALGRHLALAIKDRDIRWLAIRESAWQRLAPSRDPWFDPPPNSVPAREEIRQLP